MLAISLIIGAVSVVSAIGGPPSPEKIWIASGVGPAPGPSDKLTIDPVELDISPESIAAGENVKVTGSNAHSDVDQTPSIDFS